MLLGAPVIAAVYLQAALRRSAALRIALFVSVGAILVGAALALIQPTTTTARPPSSLGPVPAAEFTTTLQTDVGLHDPAVVRFTGRMNAASVQQAVSVVPSTPVRFAWSTDGLTLKVTPAVRWSPATFYTVTVGERATALDGRALARPVRAAFVTREPTSVHLVIDPPTAQPQPATNPDAIENGTIRLATTSTSEVPTAAPAWQPTIRVEADHPLDAAAVAAAVSAVPAIQFTVVATAPAGEPLASYVLRPAQALHPDAAYRLTIAGTLHDADGAPVAAPAAAMVRTAAVPRVVRFRPASGASAVAATATLSVRFTTAMDPDSARAFTATANGKAVTLRTVRWAEGQTVLVATPTSKLPSGAKVVMRVDTTARSGLGVPLPTAASASFRVAGDAKPAARNPKPHPKPLPRPHPKPSPGGSVGSATWYAVERYYLSLMNCTRTGGWVTSGGACSSPGGRNVRALVLSAPISSRVSRPYARFLAVHGECSHFLEGNPGTRLQKAGFTSYKWAENIGCRSGSPRAAVLGSHLYFQAEKSTNGGHYVNLMNPLYDRAGIGVWVSHGRVRLVVDFYHP